MNFTISPSSGVPIYRQMYEQLEKRILSGQLSAGEFVPSVRNIATKLQVNPMTISKAYSLLEERGYLVRVRGKGMQVAVRENHDVSSDRQTLIVAQISSLIEESQQLGITLPELKQLILDVLAKEQAK